MKNHDQIFFSGGKALFLLPREACRATFPTWSREKHGLFDDAVDINGSARSSESENLFVKPPLGLSVKLWPCRFSADPKSKI